MRSEYHIQGMTCANCVAKVTDALKGISGVKEVQVDLKRGTAEVDSNTALSKGEVASALASLGKYTLVDRPQFSKNLILQYKRYFPLIFALSLVTVWTLINQYRFGLNLYDAMFDFMGLFFLIFGFLKVANWKNFALGFRTYDPYAKVSSYYAHVYPGLEVTLGAMFYFRLGNLFLASVVTLIILSITTVGIINVLKSKQEIQCVCLGGFFNIPISWLTVFENVLMILMAITMILMI